MEGISKRGRLLLDLSKLYIFSVRGMYSVTPSCFIYTVLTLRNKSHIYAAVDFNFN